MLFTASRLSCQTSNISINGEIGITEFLVQSRDDRQVSVLIPTIGFGVSKGILSWDKYRLSAHMSVTYNSGIKNDLFSMRVESRNITVSDRETEIKVRQLLGVPRLSLSFPIDRGEKIIAAIDVGAAGKIDGQSSEKGKITNYYARVINPNSSSLPVRYNRFSNPVVVDIDNKLSSDELSVYPLASLSTSYSVNSSLNGGIRFTRYFVSTEDTHPVNSLALIATLKF